MILNPDPVRIGPVGGRLEKPAAPKPLTVRQREALDWLVARGKASEGLIRRGGFSLRTFEALRATGLVGVRSTGGPRPGRVYYLPYGR